ncbi:hypothetical protein [Solirubrobacter soli]|uniref:hypothetical protein n=1 Tax=Solirubrobacter soli TaxID=363832 RepID=UPI0004011101|nr:hypothetical protein [Solirubrobacter soli]
MPADVIERLRAADPARDVDPIAPEALLTRLKATPPRKRKRRHRALLLVPVAIAAAAAAFLIPSANTNLAARAYAQTAPTSGHILYVRTTIETTMRTPTVTKDTHAIRERWQQGERWNERVEMDGKVFGETRGADGKLRFSDGTVAPQSYVELREPGFVEEFRKRYERGTLDQSDTTTFNGRHARRYVVDEGRNRAEYFIDAESGMPLGSIEEFAVLSPGPGQPATGPNGTFTATTVVDAIEQLPATPANLDKLR